MSTKDRDFNDMYLEYAADEARDRQAEEDADAYDLDDPKHPSYYDRAVEAWDNRDKFA